VRERGRGGEEILSQVEKIDTFVTELLVTSAWVKHLPSSRAHYGILKYE
jgi:hypothetical protein